MHLDPETTGALFGTAAVLTVSIWRLRWHLRLILLGFRCPSCRNRYYAPIWKPGPPQCCFQHQLRVVTEAFQRDVELLRKDKPLSAIPQPAHPTCPHCAHLVTPERVQGLLAGLRRRIMARATAASRSDAAAVYTRRRTQPSLPSDLLKAWPHPAEPASSSVPSAPASEPSAETPARAATPSE